MDNQKPAQYKIRTYGRDCWGNHSGYCIRKTGEVCPVELFPRNIYETGSDEAAYKKAQEALKRLEAQAEKEGKEK